MAVELIMGLLENRPADDPVPVRMSAALLDTGQPQDVAARDWLVGHLTRTYRLSGAAARQLVAARMVLPVLDGLDEMDASRPGSPAPAIGPASRFRRIAVAPLVRRAATVRTASCWATA